MFLKRNYVIDAVLRIGCCINENFTKKKTTAIHSSVPKPQGARPGGPEASGDAADVPNRRRRVND
jgi:hypothetical protein